MNRFPTRRLLAAAIVVFALGAWYGLRVRPSLRPSVLLITVDTLRADHVGALGGSVVATPRMDALAAEGALFADAASASPVTLPSHTTILTGLLPPRHGIRDNSPPRSLPPRTERDFATLAETLSDAGYDTAAFVSAAPLAPRWGLDAGFTTFDAPEEGRLGDLGLSEREGGLTVDKALGHLRARDTDRPVFAWVHLFDPHHPYAPPDGSGLPTDSPEAYAEEVAYVDAQVGRLLDGLRDLGMLENTVVVLCADHGEGLGDHGEATHGFRLHRSTLHVPLLVRFPGAVAAGTRVTAAVSLTAVAPTILDLLGETVPRALDGVSLRPHLEGAADATADPQYGETVYGWRNFRWAQGVTIREGGLRAIDHGGDRRHVYDLATDPGERRDVVAQHGAALDTAVAAAWAAFTTPPFWRTPGEAAPDPGELPGYFGTVNHVLDVLGPEENAALPEPSSATVARFLAATRLVDRARALGKDGAAQGLLDGAREILADLAREDPANPAVPFWEGRSWVVEARRLDAGAEREAWLKAFLAFQRAGRLGYRDPRTVSLMLQAAHGAGEYQEMRKAAHWALELDMDGDTGFWCWQALAEIRTGVGADGRLAPGARAAAERALERAAERARSSQDEEWIAEIRALIK